jgi:hypothetical protein
MSTRIISLHAIEACFRRAIRIALASCVVVAAASATEPTGPSTSSPAAGAAAAAASTFTLPEFRTLGSDGSDWSVAGDGTGGGSAKGPLADSESTRASDELAVGPGYQVETDSALLNTYLSEMQSGVYQRYRRLFDSRSVLSSKRFFDFTHRAGNSPAFVGFDLPEGSQDDEKIAMQSAVDAARKTAAETGAIEAFIDKLSVLEDLGNWSLVKGGSGYGSGFDFRSNTRSSRSHDDSSLVDVEFSSRMSMQRLVDAPNEVFELRAKYGQIVEISLYPIKQEIEMRSPLLHGKRYDVRAAFTIDSSLSKNDFLVSFDLRF